jgi:hypothetical protein
MVEVPVKRHRPSTTTTGSALPTHSPATETRYLPSLRHVEQFSFLNSLFRSMRLTLAIPARLAIRLGTRAGTVLAHSTDVIIGEWKAIERAAEKHRKDLRQIRAMATTRGKRDMKTMRDSNARQEQQEGCRETAWDTKPLLSYRLS